ncbi:MAG: diaminopimelate epimerase [Acidobacteria bacterium]|nr:diaminopimelate epimerase [Acidobacteriota bacterium]
MRLSKHHALANDFLIGIDLDGSVAPDASFAAAVCDRRRGLGADGLIVGQVLGSGKASFSLFNSDGSTAEISGNGMRCFGQALRRLESLDVFEVDTLAGLRRIEYVEGDDEGEAIYRVSMGEVTIGDDPTNAIRKRLAVAAGAPIRAIGQASIGNPHVVMEIDDIDALDLDAVGELAQDLFGPINLHVVTLDHDATSIRMRPYERGVGATEACGTGACVAASFAPRWHGMEGAILVEMPGGDVTVTPGSDVILQGPTTFVADIELSEGL